MLMNIRRILILSALAAAQTWSSAAGFFSTSGFRLVERRGGASFSAEVDFPVEGNAQAMKGVKSWICDILEVDEPRRLEESDFQSLLRQSLENFMGQGLNTSRKVEIIRSYEDENLVTFESVVTDKDSLTWVDEDCASFSKKDGHRIQASEIFNCSEQKIKDLMWKFRDGLPVGVTSARSLVVGNAGFLDGWIVVIGPAEGYTGASYRIRYQEAEPFLRGKRSGGYYDSAGQH